jgi:predicted nucleic acid-binding Zn ribbon protein
MRIRKGNQQTIGEAIGELLDRYHLRDRMNEAKVIESWEKVVGAMVAKRTDRLRITKRVLYVRVSSAPLKNELIFARTKLIKALNKEAGAPVIDDIVFT